MAGAGRGRIDALDPCVVRAADGRLVWDLEATISVAAAVNPETGGNWEGTGVTPDIQTTADGARGTAYERALQDVITADRAAAAEARDALAAVLPVPR